MKYLPFDLEVALKHPERVITRQGQKITEIHYFETSNSYKYKVSAVIDGVVEPFTIGGRFYEDTTDSNYDLFLLPEYKEKFVNVYDNPAYGLQVGDVLDTLEQAKAFKDQEYYIKTIKITSLPYEPQHDNK